MIPGKLLRHIVRQCSHMQAKKLLRVFLWVWLLHEYPATDIECLLLSGVYINAFPGFL
jgi:hypothetical protein